MFPIEEEESMLVENNNAGDSRTEKKVSNQKLNIKNNEESEDKPIVLRVYDNKTGNYIATDLNQQGQENEVELDPELVDQTTITDLSQEDRNRLDSAAEDQLSNKNNFNYFIPMILISIIIFVGLFIINNN